jgi:predicted nucleotide-binding protein
MTTLVTSADSSEREEPAKKKRSAPLSQQDVPSYTLRDAMRVPEALRDQFAKQSTPPLDLAIALNMTVSSGPFRTLIGAAAAYGLTDGSAWAGSISLTELGRRAVAPLAEGDDAAAMKEAVLRPRVIREFLERYDQHPLPTHNVALNVIEQLNVPGTATQRAYQTIVKNAEDLGLIVETKGKKYVRLNGSVQFPALDASETAESENVLTFPASPAEPTEEGVLSSLASATSPNTSVNTRVFITHGKNTKVVEQIKKILTFGKFDAVVSVDQQTVAKPIRDKVMDDMRSCSAAIVHVGAERKLMDYEGNEHTEINPNVLIEIGAAMALYGHRFVLLVERGVTLPSNLQGLYEVRYEGEQLDHDATMKLLEAFNDFR